MFLWPQRKTVVLFLASFRVPPTQRRFWTKVVGGVGDFSFSTIQSSWSFMNAAHPRMTKLGAACFCLYYTAALLSGDFP